MTSSVWGLESTSTFSIQVSLFLRFKTLFIHCLFLYGIGRWIEGLFLMISQVGSWVMNIDLHNYQDFYKLGHNGLLSSFISSSSCVKGVWSPLRDLTLCIDFHTDFGVFIILAQ